MKFLLYTVEDSFSKNDVLMLKNLLTCKIGIH